MNSRTIVIVAGTKKEWKKYTKVLDNFKDVVSWVVDQHDENISSYCIKSKNVYRVGIVTFIKSERADEFMKMMQGVK